MNIYFATVNAFVEDTCVIIVVAYLLTRGRMLSLLFRTKMDGKQTLLVGFTLGYVAVTETVFPGARYPYVTSTLIVTFASLTCGLSVGLITAAVSTMTAAVLQPTQAALGTAAPVFLSALLGAASRNAVGAEPSPLQALGVGCGVQLFVVLFRYGVARALHLDYAVHSALVSIPANGFGLLLLLLVVRDSRTRATSIQHREEAEHARSLVAEAKLSALRARIHPHFLFNALTSIAALCTIAPDTAETAIVRLSHQMRRVLANDPNAPICLREEIEQVKDYVEIEQLRLGSRLRVDWEIDVACEHLTIPAFALQTLVENAVNHGIAPQIGAGAVRIIVKRRANHALISVIDTGMGLPLGVRTGLHDPDGPRSHGLQILTQQVLIHYGKRCRLRLFSGSEKGTIAAFAVPFDVQGHLDRR